MSGRIESIIIVGGGTAGWLSAIYLQRALPKNLQIFLVESKDVPCIGVGESTFPTLAQTIKFLGIDEKDFLRETCGTYKGAIKYVGWEKEPNEKGRNYWWHPFFPRNNDLYLPYEKDFFPYLGEGFSLSHIWQKKRSEGKVKDFDYTFFLSSSVCKENKSPMGVKGQEEEFRYAYHVDAGLVGDYFKKMAKNRGVKHVIGHVLEVKNNERGEISELRLENGKTMTADFFVDCTGFARVLTGKNLGGNFISDSDSLFCNSAVAIQTKNNPEISGIRPFTTATAKSSGWIWEVPLINRNGTGYVYSDNFLKKDAAEKELREHLAGSATVGDALHLKFPVGRMDQIWKKNCVAIGLSGIFLEPLEATSILFSELQLAVLVNMFPAKDASPYRAKKYNEIINGYYDEVRDFIILHYYLTKRRDTDFWKAVQYETVIPESLKMKIELQKENFMVLDDKIKFPLFTSQSYHCIFSGMNYLPKGSYSVLEHLPNLKDAEAAIEMLENKFDKLLPMVPDHYHHLKSNVYGDV